MIFPPALRIGDKLALIAPSGPFDRTLARRGMGWLGEHFRIQFQPGIFQREGYLAGGDRRRAEELSWALDSDAKGVMAIRGGYGLSRIVHEVDWGAFRQHPKWLVGFSDFTVLHVESAAAGIASMHASMVASLGRADFHRRAEVLASLLNPHRIQTISGLKCWRSGSADGPLFGGNLTMLHACATAGRLAIPIGAILVLEDVSEHPYRIDRMLTTLLRGGHLRQVAGIALGEFTGCHPGPDGVEAAHVLKSTLSQLEVPVVSGLPIGHGRRNIPLVFGARAHLVADQGEITLG